MAHDSNVIVSAAKFLSARARPLAVSVQHPWRLNFPMVCLLEGPVGVGVAEEVVVVESVAVLESVAVVEEVAGADDELEETWPPSL